jgi:hypothetical protein
MHSAVTLATKDTVADWQREKKKTKKQRLSENCH